MTLNHIQLNTTDVEAQARFYQTHFAFTKKVPHGEGVFLWNDKGFMMAINPLPEKPVFPSWFHVGFHLPSAADVAAKFKQLEEAGVKLITPLKEFDDFVFFRCHDPAGYEIEVFWEPVPA